MTTYSFQHAHLPLKSTPCCRVAQCRPSCTPSPPPPPCATHLLKRRPPACMWLWTVCHRPALLPPVTMLRTLSLRLGPAPAPEQAPPPLSLAPGEGPAPPCPPLSAAPLIDTVRRTGNKETRTHRKKKREREKERKTRWTEDGTDGQVGQQNKGVSKN